MKNLSVITAILACFILACGAVQMTGTAGTPATGGTDGTFIYEAYGCERDALRDAVITCLWTDCEAGPQEREIDEAEQESIRNLAMNGKITGRENEMNVTGNTTIYVFTAPDGKHLMSLEFYHGLLVENDGMYNYTDE